MAERGCIEAPAMAYRIRSSSINRLLCMASCLHFPMSIFSVPSSSFSLSRLLPFPPQQNKGQRRKQDGGSKNRVEEKCRPKRLDLCKSNIFQNVEGLFPLSQECTTSCPRIQCRMPPCLEQIPEHLNLGLPPSQGLTRKQNVCRASRCRLQTPKGTTLNMTPSRE